MLTRVWGGTVAGFQRTASVWNGGGSMRGGWWRPHTISGWSGSFLGHADVHLSPLWLPTLIPSSFHYPHPLLVIHLCHQGFAYTNASSGTPTQFNLTHPSGSPQDALRAGNLLYHLPIHLASRYYVPRDLWGAGASAVDNRSPCPNGTYFLI